MRGQGRGREEKERGREGDSERGTESKKYIINREQRDGEGI